MANFFDYPPEHFTSSPEAAVEPLAACLRSGTLSLVVGAGASKAGLGLPVWWDLVQRCLSASGLTDEVNEDTPNEQLRRKMDKVENTISDDNNYMELVHKCLYEGVNYSGEILKQELLIAFGALLMSSKRGSICEVINFNFDDVIEWYLRLHGFETQVIVEMPSILKSADVTVYHPHGYLPKLVGHPSNFLIFSQKSYDTRMAEYVSHWEILFSNILRTKYVLFVGLSGDDPTFGPILMRVKKEIEKNRPTGFWIFGDKKDADDIAYFTDRNMIPLCFDGYDKIPTFLLEICQRASSY